MLSLIELGRELMSTDDLFEAVTLLLLNIMGEFGTSRSALWLLTDEKEPHPVLIRSHGFKKEIIGQVGEACHQALAARFQEVRRPMVLGGLDKHVDQPEFALVHQAGIAFIAPLVTRGELFGWLALGPRVNGEPFAAEDVQVLETSIGMVGTALHSALLYRRLLETNRRLQTMNQHLNELDALKTKFLSHVNHELRTPLAVINATLECMLDQTLQDERLPGLLSAALEKSNDMRRMIENLLNFTDMTNERLPVQVDTLDIAEALDTFHRERLPGLVTLLREFKYARDESLPWVQCDRLRLFQILDQLVDNAIKFTPRGTAIHLRAEGPAAGERHVLISLQDEGAGIPPDRLRALFGAFEQVDDALARRVGGLGMGLAVAAGIAARMGCKLSVESTPGKGSTFSLSVPVAGADAQPKAA